MTFSIKPIDPKLFAEIYTPAVAKELDQFIYATNNWSNDLSLRTWAIDESDRACLLQVKMADRMNSDQSYAFVWNQNVVLIKEVRYSTFAIVHASQALSSQMDQVTQMMRGALRVGGRLLNGVTDPNHSWAVPNAEFITE